MKIADLTIGARYADLGTGKFDEYDTAGIVRSGVPCTVVMTLPGGKVKVQYREGGPVQEIRASRLHPLDVLLTAQREQRERDERDSAVFDARLVQLEEARQRIVEHLAGLNLPYIGYDLSLDGGLGKEVKAHADRSGYWNGTGIRLDYVQIATLLDAVANKEA